MKREISFSQDLRMNHERLPGGGCVLKPQGAIDSLTSEQFRNRVQEFLDQDPDLLLDLGGVKYISSMGLGALIQLLKNSRRNGSAFALYGAQLAVRRVLEISKLDFLLVKPDEASTLGRFAGYVASKESERLAAEASAAAAKKR